MKTPVMRSLQNYNTQAQYSLLTSFMVWLSLFIISIVALLLNAFSSKSPLDFPRIMLILMAIYQFSHTGKIPLLGVRLQPRWYCELVERSSYDDLRQLAYMWLRLPPRLKISFELNDRAFFAWSDLVILSIGAQVSDEFVHSRTYRLNIARLKQSLHT